MATARETDGIFESANLDMLTELELVKATKPEKYADVAEFAERIHKYFIKASGIKELDPVPRFDEKSK